MTSDELIKLLLKNGWYKVSQKGSHRTYKHPDFAEHITVPHPEKDLKKGLVNSILKTAGLKK